jgi:8-oxo-dGTP pyrophosphatase MutT (NUDIX family)
VVHPLPPPAWAVGPGARRPLTVADVRRAMAAAPEPAPLGPDDREVTGIAGVLVAVFDDGGDAWILLTRRAAHLRRNAGDVSFPGGRQEVDEDIVATALREAQEEVGLDPSTVAVVGELDHTVTVTGIEMVPIVGVLAARPVDLVVHPGEVDAVLTVRLADLLVAERYRGELWWRDDPPAGPVARHMHEFDLEGDTIWGATARILHRFLELLAA